MGKIDGIKILIGKLVPRGIAVGRCMRNWAGERNARGEHGCAGEMDNAGLRQSGLLSGTIKQ
jgi:hypothetical protein